MKILLYGAKGLLGKEFIKYNEQYGKHELIIGKNNISEKIIFSEIFESKADVILNFAGFVTYDIDYSYSLFYSNVLGPINLVNQARLVNRENRNINKIKVITIGSTCDLEVENVNMYSYSKKCLLGLIDYFDNLHIVRLPGIFSANRRNGAIYNFLKNAKKNKEIIIDSNLSEWNCLYSLSAIDEIYQGIDELLIKQVTTIGYSDIYSLESVANEIKKYVNSESKIIVNNQPLKSLSNRSYASTSKSQNWIYLSNGLSEDLKKYVDICNSRYPWL